LAFSLENWAIRREQLRGEPPYSLQWYRSKSLRSL